TVDTHILKSGAVLIGESETDAQLEVDKERLISGLAEGLIGQAAGETNDIALTLPADYPKKDLAGQHVVFRITVKSIKERRLPALDNELAKQVGRGETFDELRQEVHDELQEAAHQADEQRFENDVLKALDERMEAEVPEALIEREVSRRVRELEVRLQEQGVKMDRYLQYTNTSMDVLKAEQRPQAVQKVRLELALETVAEREGLAVSEAEVDEAVANALAEEDHVGHRHADLRTADPVRAYFRHQLLMRKTIDYLSSVAAPESSATMEPPSEAKELESAGKSASGGERRARQKKGR
ncbi:MAG: trigger factor, partial [Candidatus Dormibacteraeota bacterium]|nr:trigger factor [Candidatus Dormibacteraeota bacterium]